MAGDESPSWHSAGVSHAVSGMEPASHFPESVSLVLAVLRVSGTAVYSSVASSRMNSGAQINIG